MTPGVCATCGDTSLTRYGTVLPEVDEWHCPDAHPTYWDVRADQELTLKDVQRRRHAWGEA